MSSSKKPRVLIMAGGTGGHVFPGLAIADALRAEGKQIFWLGTEQGLEARLVPAANIPLSILNVTGLRGKSLKVLLEAPFYLLRAFFQALKILWKIKPHLVIGMGGFVSGPGALAAKLLRIPVLIHEQNAVAGLTNRWLARIADRVLTAFPQAFPASINAVCTGNPLRKSFEMLPEPKQRYQQRSFPPLKLLVLGGSLGAASLNDIVPKALALLPLGTSIVVKHQTGQKHFAVAQHNYASLAVESEVLAFIEDMPAAYAWADLAVCRAGASTISELTAVGLPAILVPYPFAVDDHQTKNGAFLVAGKSAIMVPQPELTPEKLGQLLLHFIQHPQELQIMAEAAKKLYQKNPTSVIIRFCNELIQHGN